MNFRFILFASLILAGCIRPEPATPEAEIPERLIDRDSVVMMITDLHLAEAASQFIIKKNIKTDSVENEVYAAVFAKYNISKSLFQQNINYYKSKPEELALIYEDALVELTKRQADLMQETPNAD